MAAIRAFDEPIVLLLGGRDKNLPWEELAELVHERVDHVVLFGEAADKIEKALGTDNAAGKPTQPKARRNAAAKRWQEAAAAGATGRCGAAVARRNELR